jgi:hypothetical protein
MDRWSETTSTKQSSNIHKYWIYYIETKGTYRNPAKNRLAYAGIHLNSIRQIASHSSTSTTQHYIDDNPYKIADILKAI